MIRHCHIYNSSFQVSALMIALVFLMSFFADTAKAELACDKCHSMPPVDSASRNPATGGFKGSHAGHSAASTNSCIPCHGSEVTSYVARHSSEVASNKNKPIIKIAAKLHNYSIASGKSKYSRGTFFNQTSIPPSPLGTCSNVNCHFETLTPAWGSVDFVSPADCNKCHGAPPNGASTGAAGSHAKHNIYYSGATNCQKCHSNNTTFQHATSAGNRSLNISFAAAPNNGSGAYSGALNDYLPSQNNTFGDCTNTYCHSIGTKSSPPYSAPYQTATWGGTLDCGGCHAAIPETFGSHIPHVSTAYGVPVPCYKCHALTVTAGPTISTPANHVNKLVNVAFDSTTTAVLGRYSGLLTPMQKNPGSGLGKCENVYCHSNAQNNGGTGITYSTPKWGSAATGKCGTCHNSGYHGGTPISSGSHKKHLDSGLDSTVCGLCHYGAGLTTPGCGVSCHKMTDPPSSNLATLHVNGNVNVSFVTKFGGTYSGTPKPGDGYGTCNTNYCHSNGLVSSPTYSTPTWGTASTGACNTCHGVTAAAPPASIPHRKHLSSENPYLFACAVCHRGKVQVTANSSIQPAYANTTSHVNKLRDVKFNSISPFGTYSSVNQSCRNLYCHSIGNLNVPASALPAVYNGKAYARQTWSGSLSCNGCHGRSTSSGMPDYTNGGVATATANSHSKHVSSSAIACVQCHEKTTKTGTTIRSTIPSKHVDGTTHDVFFNLSSLNLNGTYNNTRQRCYNIYCHSNGTAASGPFAPYSTTQWGNTLNCAKCHRADLASGLVMNTGSHAGHVNKWGYNQVKCYKCHAVTSKADMTIATTSRHANQQVEIAFDSSSSAANGSYIGTLATPASPMVKAPGSVKGKCTNIYCHSSVQTDGAGTPPTYFTTPTWGDGTVGMSFCGNCHGNPYNHVFGTETPLVTGSHSKHLKFQYYNYYNNIEYRDFEKCVVCHSYTRTAFNPLTCNGGSCHARNKHSNYEINVGIPEFFGASASYNKATTKPGAGYYSTCSAVYCHSDGLATPISYYTPTWGNPSSGACGTCHGVNSAAPPASAQHIKHVGNAFPYIIACAACHSGKVQVTANSGIQPTYTNLTTHVNKLRDVTFNSISPYGTYSSVNQSCRNLYCHSIGNLNVTAGALPAVYNGTKYSRQTWSGTLSCNGCHGRSTEDGEPDYTNGGPASPTANSHSKHLSYGDISCSECHRRTTINGTTIRTDIFPSSHVNTVKSDIFFNLSGNLSKNGNYAPDTKTCTTVFCHSNGRGTYKPAQWGVTDNCDYCHPIAALGGAHAKHVDLLQTVTFYTYTANRSTSSGYNFGCSNCHPISTSSSHPILPIMIDFRPDIAGVGTLRSKNSSLITAAGPVGTPNSGTTADSVTNSVVKCVNVYCHSNGYALNTAYATTPNWYGGLFSGDKCANCHGNSPNSTIVGSAAHYSTNFMGQGVTDGHLVGIHYDTIFTGTNGLAPIGSSNVSGHGNATTATTISCNLCHYATVTITSNDKNVVCASCHNGTQAALRGDSDISNKSNHVNGVADVSFNPIKIRSKAQMLNSAVITPYSTVWTRNGGYKTPGSYDESKNALDTATSWDSPTKTCSNVSCHNNMSVKWGSTNGSTSCQRCHPNM